jgi:hypothetical protein
MRGLSGNGCVWLWPEITAAITAKDPWRAVVCDSCGTVLGLDLRENPRDPEAPVRVALKEVRWPRCNGHGRPRVLPSFFGWRPSLGSDVVTTT